MTISEQIIYALRTRKPELDQTKAALEQDKSAIAISRIFGEPLGLELIEYISEELKNGKLPLYLINKNMGETEFQKLIEIFYNKEEKEALNILLLTYHQLLMDKKDTEAEIFSRTLKKLGKSDAISSYRVILSICLDCYSCINDDIGNICNGCGSKNLLKVNELKISDTARAVLKNGQHLELYVKESMKKCGIELIGWEDGNRKKIFTSVKYQVEGEQIDIDVLGISQPLSVLFCEAKTSKNIKMNELRRVENLFDRLLKILKELTNIEIPHLKVFITTGKFDMNISIDSYKRRGWELIDRRKILNLAEEFKRLQNEI